MIKRKLNLYAKYNINYYAITISSNNTQYGSVSESSFEAEYNSMITIEGNKITIGNKEIIATPTPNTIQNSYAFVNWSISPVCENVKGDISIVANFKETTNAYEIKFLNYDGTELQKSNLSFGEMPTYDGATPTKPATAEFTYTFSGWDKEISNVTGDTTYTAIFTKIKNKYLITFKNEDGSIIEAKEFEYGTIPNCSQTPTKPATAEFTYTFSGWDKEISNVTGDETYIAIFTKIKNKYLITFKNEDGSIIETKEFEYGTIPSCSQIPTKEPTIELAYTFNGWLPKVVSVTGEATYKATFREGARQYTYTFYNEDGSSVVSTGAVDYNSIIPLPQDPIKKGHEFVGWSLNPDGEVADLSNFRVVENVDIYALFSVLKYTITCLNSENGVLSSEKSKCDYGDISKLTFTPNEGFILSAYFVNGERMELQADELVLGVKNISFIMPDSNVELTPEFSIAIKTKDGETINWAYTTETENGEEFTYINQIPKCDGVNFEIDIPAFLIDTDNENKVVAINGVRGFRSGPIANVKDYKTVNLPTQPSFSRIGKYAFNYCTKLFNINITSNISFIGDGAFNNIAKTDFYIPSSVQEIGENVFGRNSITSLIISPENDTFTDGGVNAIINKKTKTLEYATTLTTSIPDSVLVIGSGAFSNYCFSGAFVIPNSIVEIKESAFRSSNFESIVIPSSVEIIGKEAFLICSKLSSIILNCRITELSSSMFRGCDLLEEITLPSSIISVGEADPFERCPNLKNIKIDGENSLLSFDNNLLIINDGVRKKIIHHITNSEENIAIANDITEICDGAYSYDDTITSVNFPGNVKIASKSVFYRCSNLTYLTLNEGIEIIKVLAFGSNKIEKLIIPNSVSIIEASTFYTYSSSLTTIIIGTPEGSNLKKIGKTAFGMKSHTFDLIIYANIPPVFDEPDSYIGGFSSIKVPSGSVQSYKEAEGWSKYADVITAI